MKEIANQSNVGDSKELWMKKNKDSRTCFNSIFRSRLSSGILKHSQLMQQILLFTNFYFAYNEL